MQPPSFFLWKFLPNKLLPFLSRFFTAYISNYFCINVRTQPSNTHSAVSAIDVRRARGISFLSTSSSTIKEKSHLSQSPKYPQAQSFNSRLSHSQIFPFRKISTRELVHHLVSEVHSFISHYSSFIPSYSCQLHPQQMGKGMLSTAKGSVSIFLSILKRNTLPVLISTKLQPPHLGVANTPRLRLVEIGYSESPSYHHNISRLDAVTAYFQLSRRTRILQHLRRASTVRHLVLLHFPL
jgi:hypothetical protein